MSESWGNQKKKYSDIFKNIDKDLRDLSKTLRKKGCIVMSNTPPSEPITELYIHTNDKSVMFQFNSNWIFSIHGEGDSETFIRDLKDEKWRLPERLKDGRYILRFLYDHGVEEDKSEFIKQLGPYRRVVEGIKSLESILKESLLDNEKDLINNHDKILISEFLENNYRGDWIISDEPNSNGKYEVSSKRSVIAINKKLTSLTNELFIFKYINGYFNCDGCEELISLKGAPKEIKKSFSCNYCYSLTSLKGAPEKVGTDFRCYGCSGLTSLKGAPKKIKGCFDCSYCKSLTSLEGAPEEIGDYFDCRNCKSLISLKGAPKKVFDYFNCSSCKGQFTEEDVEKVSDVKGYIQFEID